MIGSVIFLLILATAIMAIRGRRRSTIVLQLVSLVAVVLLFAHHVTDRLGLSF
ncbi:MAG: DUF5993 family protein [Planctomycetota bacterium]|nr:DUF5993 family protein [Planctomycetota bacterium]